MRNMKGTKCKPGGSTFLHLLHAPHGESCSSSDSDGTRMTVVLKNQTASALHAALAHAGVTPRLARQLQAAAVRHDEFPPVGPGAPARVLAEVRALARIPRLAQVDKIVSARDGFAKY